MITTRIKRLAQGMLIGSLLILGLTGCVRRTPPPAAYVTPATTVQPAGAYASQPNVRRFVVTETQQRYYVDSQGRMHHIVREVTQPAGGMVYYIENDARPYYIDESQRLYYREPTGGIFYIDEVKPIQPSGPSGVYPQHGYHPGYYASPQSGPGLYYTVPDSRSPGYQQPGYPQTYYPQAGYQTGYPAMSSESCASQYQRCVDACQGLSRREAYTRPQCLSNCETIRNNCR